VIFLAKETTRRKDFGGEAKCCKSHHYEAKEARFSRDEACQREFSFRLLTEETKERHIC
jgi:hypothetical protein